MNNPKILSPAMLKTYQSCKKKYFLHYVRNIVMPQPATIFEQGKNIHALAGYYLNGINVEKFEKNLGEKEKDIWIKLKNNEYFNFTPIKTEFTLSFKLENFWFGGRLDAIMKNQNEYYILDYKTGNPPDNAEYDYQTMVYITALSKYLKNTNNINFVYIDLKNNKNILINATPNLIKEYEAKLRQLMQDYNQKEKSKLTSLVKLYTTMKTKDAARIMATLDIELVTALLKEMKPSTSSAILSQMDAAKAKAITNQLIGNSLSNIEK